MNETTQTKESNLDKLSSSSISQMRKGVLVYAVLLICSHGKVYSSDIITRLRKNDLIVVEGTLYPLLSRLGKDGLLQYEWQESEQGPPRKYYWLTDEGQQLLEQLKHGYQALHASVQKLEKGA
jgi:PadR family transcriptional regulator PadR